MRINTKMRLAALLYLMAAYAVALPALALFTDLVINGAGRYLLIYPAGSSLSS